MENEAIEPGPEAPTSTGPDPFLAIEAEARGMEFEAEAAQAEAMRDPNAPHEVDQAAVWAQIPFMVGGMLAMAMPELKPVYSLEACHAWGAGMAAVSQKYGWDAGETMSKWAPECALVVASIPLLVPTMKAIKTRQEAAKAAERAKLQKRRENAVEAHGGIPVGPISGPMGLEPGNFSEPH